MQSINFIHLYRNNTNKAYSDSKDLETKVKVIKTNSFLIYLPIVYPCKFDQNQYPPTGFPSAGRTSFLFIIFFFYLNSALPKCGKRLAHILVILNEQNEISPLAILYHSSPIPMSMQSLKKIAQKVLKLEHGNEALTDKHSKFGGYNIIPRHFLCGGV